MQNMLNRPDSGRSLLRSALPFLRVLMALSLLIGGAPFAGGEVSAAPVSLSPGPTLASPPPLAAQSYQPSTTFVVPVQQDSYLAAGSPTQNFGAATELLTDSGTNNQNKQPVLRFDLAQIPVRARVLSATLYLFVTKDSAEPLSLYRVTAPWTEDTATWASLAASYDPSPIGSLRPTLRNQFAGADITATVQDWVADGIPNHGLMLVADTLNNESRYAARESDTAAKRPYLEVVIATATVTLDAQKDTALWQPADLLNYGACNRASLGTSGGSIGNGRPLFQFDLGVLPSPITILSAQLQLTKIGGAIVHHKIKVYPVTAAWDEGSGNCAGDLQAANWQERQPGVPWAEPGGDYEPTYVAVTTVKNNGQYTWDLSDLVGQWRAGSRPNFGVVLGTPDTGTDLFEFASREHADPSLRPRLLIKYAVPAATIAGQVWDDANRNGLYDSGEAGLPQIGVDLYPGVCGAVSTAASQRAYTGVDGHYWFTNLADGQFCVRVDENTLPPSYGAVDDRNPLDLTLDSTSNLTSNLTATPTDPSTILDADFAYAKIFADDRLTVGAFAPCTDIAWLEAFARDYNTTFVTRDFNTCTFRLTGGVQDVADLRAAVDEHTHTLFDEYDLWIAGQYTPNDPDYNNPNMVYSPQLINAPLAWDTTLGDPGVILAVLDTGIDRNHPEFAGRLLPGWDFANDDADPSDDNGHGTSVAGIAAASIDNGTGSTGIAGRVTILPIKVLNDGNTGWWSDVSAGITYAVNNGAKVINLSMGGASGSNSMQNAIAYALSKGVIVVAAAGNNGNDVPFYPAAYDSVLAAGAVESTSTRWSYSNYGNNIDLMAPGTLVWNTYWTAAGGSGYIYMSGTSMAAPHVAGAAALLYSINPNLTPAEIRTLLYETATDLGAPGVDTYYANGLIDIGAAVAGLQPVALTPPTTAIQSILTVDVDGNGLADPGDTLRYQVSVANANSSPLAGVVVSATLPAGAAYLAASSRINGIPVLDNSAPATLFPWDAGGITLGDVPANGQTTVSFDVQVGSLPAGVYAVIATATVKTDAETVVLTETTPVAGALLRMAVDKPTATAGETLAYTVTSAYIGNELLQNVGITVGIPAGTVYVPGSANAGGTVSNNVLSWNLGGNGAGVTATQPTDTTYFDRFDAIAYTGSNGTVNWTPSPWVEINETDGASAGFARVVADQGDNSLRVGGSGPLTFDDGSYRVVDLSAATSASLSFDQRRQTGGVRTPRMALWIWNGIGGNNGWHVARSFTLNTTDSAYSRVDVDLAAYLGVSNLRVAFAPEFAIAQFSNDYWFIDNVKINLAPSATSLGNTLGATPTLVQSGVQSGSLITVTMRLTATQNMANVSPSALVLTGTNGVNATLVSGPTPASGTVGPAGRSYTWVYRATAGSQAGQLTFGATATDGSTAWPQAQSNSVIVHPPLTFRATIDNPPPVAQIQATATLSDSGNLLPSRFANRVTTDLLGSIGDFVWNDMDGDGIQDAGEAGIPAITVRLTNSAGQTVSAITDGGGRYTFSPVLPGAYTVTVDGASVPAAYTLVTTAYPVSVVLGPGQTMQGADVGLKGPATSVGDRIWYDSNGDGIQDPNEPGLGNISLSLYFDDGDGLFNPGQDYRADSTVSNSAGAYRLDAPAPGNYFVDVTDDYNLLAGLSHTIGSQSQGEPTPMLTLAAGQIRLDLDFGYVRAPASGNAVIGDLVWADVNGNHLREPDEAILSQVEVCATPLDGGAPLCTQTDSNGRYLLEVPLDVYSVGPTEPPLGLTPTGSQPVVVNALYVGQHLSADFGYRADGQAAAGLGGQIWQDLPVNEQYDGLFDADLEPGIPNVSVNVIYDTNANGTWDAAEPYVANVTSVAGLYLFDKLLAGPYVVRVVDTLQVLRHFAPTVAGPAGSSGQSSQSQPHAVTLLPGQIDNSGNFGYREYEAFGTGSLANPGVIGNLIFLDANGDGVYRQIDGDRGIPGVTLVLAQNGTPVATTTSGSDGAYLFTDLAPGAYTVDVTDQFGVLAGHAATTGPLAGQDNQSQSHPYTVVLGLNPTNMTGDFGYMRLVTLGDQVWWDVDGDGLQSTGEPGLPGVPLELRNGADTLLATTISDQDGRYQFTDLLPVSYTVAIADSVFLPGGLLAGWSPSPQHTGGDVLDSDGDGATRRVTVSPGVGEQMDRVDFGFTVPTEIGVGIDSPGVVRVGEVFEMRIILTNTGHTWLSDLPISLVFDPDYLAVVNITPTSNGDGDDGLMVWDDGLAGAGVAAAAGELGPGMSVDLVVTFKGAQDSTYLPGSAAPYTLTVMGGMGDPDGSGGSLSGLPLLSQTVTAGGVGVVNPTAVPLAEMAAQTTADGVHLSWRTVDESRVAGFHVWRQAGAGDAMRITDTPLAAQFGGQPTGGVYALTDSTVASGLVVYEVEMLLSDGTFQRLVLGQVGESFRVFMPLVSQ